MPVKMKDIGKGVDGEVHYEELFVNRQVRLGQAESMSSWRGSLPRIRFHEDGGRHLVGYRFVSHIPGPYLEKAFNKDILDHILSFLGKDGGLELFTQPKTHWFLESIVRENKGCYSFSSGQTSTHWILDVSYSTSDRFLRDLRSRDGFVIPLYPHTCHFDIFVLFQQVS